MKIAIFGGSFNPVHNGHINIVREVTKAVMLDKIFIMPTFISPFKKTDNTYIANGNLRFEMCRLAFKDMENVTVSNYELSKKDVSYTIHTLEYFHKKFPNDDLYFIMGSDMLKSLHLWYHFEDIMKLCTIIAASRVTHQSDFDELTKIAEKLRQYGEILLVNTSAFEVSSTIIREKIIKNEDISCYVPQNVVKYILNNKLYLDLKTDVI